MIIVIFDAARALKNFSIEVSQNGTDWQDVFVSDHQIIKNLFYCYFDTVTAPYVRLNIKEGFNNFTCCFR